MLVQLAELPCQHWDKTGLVRQAVDLRVNLDDFDQDLSNFVPVVVSIFILICIDLDVIKLELLWIK